MPEKIKYVPKKSMIEPNLEHL